MFLQTLPKKGVFKHTVKRNISYVKGIISSGWLNLNMYAKLNYTL